MMATKFFRVEFGSEGSRSSRRARCCSHHHLTAAHKMRQYTCKIPSAVSFRTNSGNHRGSKKHPGKTLETCHGELLSRVG
jgi:hypothetical protein